MNKKILLIPLLLVLASCNNENLSTSPSSTPSTSVSISDSTSNSTSAEPSKSEQLTKFYEQLKASEGHVKSANVNTTQSIYYLTEGEPLTMSVKDISKIERFTSDDGQIMVQKGQQSTSKDSLGNFTNFFDYETQTFYDSEKFYKISDFGDTGSYKEIAFSESAIDDNLNVGFPGTEKANIQTMIEYADIAGYEVQFSGLNDYKANGEWKYSYTFIIYASSTSKVKYQEFIYENTLTLANGIITHVNQHSETNVYSGGYKGNWMIVDESFDFTQGEYDKFSGNSFNPTDYKKYE